jgi:hypothetical protein
MKPLALLCSDTHVRPRREDEKHAFRQIIDRAVKEKIPIIAAGDLIDKQTNRAETITFLYKQLDRLGEAGQRFYFTQGQHDYDFPAWLSAHPIAFHLHKEVIDFDEFVVYGLDWQPYGKLQEELAEIPDTVNFLVCHQVWSNWMGDIAAPQGSFEQIPGHITIVHTGDLHQWKLERQKNADGKKMLVVSCGATAQQKIDEPDTHNYALLYPDGKVERQRLNSRVMVDCSIINRLEDVEAFMADLEPLLETAAQRAAAMELPDEMAKPYMRVTYSSKLPDTVRRVEKVVADRALLVFKQLLPPEKLDAYQKAKKVEKGEAVTPLSVLSEEVSKDDKPGVYELVERLLTASDKELEFARWRSEFLGETSGKE